MAIKLINLGESSYKPIPEGWNTLKITNVDYNNISGKMVIDMETQDGRNHKEFFTLISEDGEANIGAVRAFSYFASTAMDDFSLEEIDEQDLVGRFMEAEVSYQPSKKVNEKTGEPYMNTRLNGKKPSAGWGEEEESNSEETLDSLIGLLDD